MDFVHLHRHSEWSLGDGTGSNEQYAVRAAELNQPALAITDHGSLAGTLYHIQACEKAGIKPILGMEAYFRPNIEKDRENKNQYGYFHLILLAQNEKGWKNLMRISSRSHDDEHYYQKPSVDWRMLEENSEGIIATSSCLAGYIPQAIMHGEEKAAIDHLLDMSQIFDDRFYFEIQPHDIPEQVDVNRYIMGWAQSVGIPMIATADVHSPYQDWTETQNIRVMIAQNKSFKDTKDKEVEDKEYGRIPTTYLMSADEIQNTFALHHHTLTANEVMAAIKETVELANRCEAITIDKSPKVPRASGSLLEAERTLRKWCEEGLTRIEKSDNHEYRDRMELELRMMRKLKVLDYFVFVGDMVRYAKTQGIRVGPGRGSAAGSLVCYLTRITGLDPIGYDLLFERFLNEYRTEIPDIDIDFDPARRHEVKEYLVNKWGADKVIDVAAFQSFGLKAAIKDVARALGVSYTKTSSATDTIPDKTFGETLETLEEQLPELKSYFEEFPEVRTHAMRLQGQIKQSSKHAAAVIVTDQPAEELIPLMRSKNGETVTQWSERANAQLLSPYGFLKIDMLVTDALTAQAKAFNLLVERQGLPYNNVNDFFESVKEFPVVESPLKSNNEVVETFGHGRNLGIFQFSSRGISGLLRQIKPRNLDHIIAANALYRPGTLSNGMAFEYAERKNGKEWRLPHSAVEPFLAKTFGIMVFQEQVMQMYRALGKDVESSESAVFLKVVAKGIARDLKGKEKLQAYYEKFAAGCRDKDIPKKAYDELWEQILAMTTYAFNRSHSAGYGLQAYQDAWIKKNYPLEFYSPLLTTEDDKIPQIIRESRAFGLHILPPDINKSDAEFTIDGNAIRFGLLAVKGIGAAGLQEIRLNRPFESLAHFEEIIPKRKCNSAARAALVDCGAFDTLGERSDWSVKDKSSKEKDILGLALSSAADVVKHRKLIEEYNTLPEDFEAAMLKDGMVQIGGEIIKLSDHSTKKGNPYTRVIVEFDGQETKINFWQDEYAKYRHMLAEGAAVIIAGEYDVEYKSISARYCVTAEQLATEIKKEKK